MARRDPGQPLAEGLLVDAPAGLVERFLRPAVLDQLDPHQAALGPDVADEAVLGHHLRHPRHGQLAEME